LTEQIQLLQAQIWLLDRTWDDGKAGKVECGDYMIFFINSLE